MEIRDLQETADLARLKMSEQELQGILPAFREMLSFFDTMEAADQDKTSSDTSNEEGIIAACLRSDNADPGNPDLCEKMLAEAGERDGRFVVIPNVL